LSSVLLLLSRPVWTCAMVSPLGAMDDGWMGRRDLVACRLVQVVLLKLWFVAAFDLAMATIIFMNWAERSW